MGLNVLCKSSAIREGLITGAPRGAPGPAAKVRDGDHTDGRIAGPWRARRSLSKRQHAGARLVRPVEADDRPLPEFRFAIQKHVEKRGAAYFRDKGLPTEEYNARGLWLSPLPYGRGSVRH
jgi:hypothetical protein